MSAYDELSAAIAAEREQTRARLASLEAQITALQGETLTPEQVANLVDRIQAITPDESAPTGPAPKPTADPNPGEI